MIFESLYAAAQRGELLLLEGGFCHWHLRRDGQLTIREIIAHPPGRGVGTAMLDALTQTPRARCIVAKCPANLEANRWYAARGFVLIRSETTRSGRGLNTWRLDLSR